MPLTKGLILLTYFSITCGVLTAINSALLQKVGGVPEGASSVVPSLAIAFIETVALLEFIDRYFIRSHTGARWREVASGQTGLVKPDDDNQKSEDEQKGAQTSADANRDATTSTESRASTGGPLFYLRRDMTITHEWIDQREYYVLRVPDVGNDYRIKVQEYFIASRLDGMHSLTEIQEEFSAAFAPVSITLEDLEQFVQQLVTAGMAFSAPRAARSGSKASPSRSDCDER